MAGSESVDTSTSIPSQLAILVPSFDPSKDDLQVYQQKVQLVLAVWPTGKVSELVTRLILNTTGSAFAKLQLHHEELCINDQKSVRKLIELLGGHWGQIGLEKKYADAERALFQCTQKSDESHDSFLARADIMWTKLKTQKLKIDDLQAYITLRGSLLSSDDKKRVILESDSSLEGQLTINKVQEAIRLLGTSFFQDMTGINKTSGKTKVYDQVHATMDETETQVESEDHSHAYQHEEIMEEEVMETLLTEGDEDASFVADFENAAADLLQGDADLSAAFSAYTETRRKLSEKVRFRGFWPLQKGRGKGGKGKGKAKNPWSGRKSLQQRILDSNCRLCGRKGHWKGECPMRGQSASASAASAPVTLSVGAPSNADEIMPMEFMNLPEVDEVSHQDNNRAKAFCYVQSVFSMKEAKQPVDEYNSDNIRAARGRIRNYVLGNIGNKPKVATLVSRIEARLRASDAEPSAITRDHMSPIAPSMFAKRNSTAVPAKTPVVQASAIQFSERESAEAMFSTHDTCGIVDTGATKTVIGSEHVTSLLQGLSHDIRKQVKRCRCDVIFRFGNQGLLKSEHAIVVPIGSLGLKIAVVPGTTPFLLSNTLLRALNASIDTSNNCLMLPKQNAQVRMQLSPKGLYLLDINQLIKAGCQVKSASKVAETFAHDSLSEPAKNFVPMESNEEVKELNEGAQVNTGISKHFHAHSLQSEKNHKQDINSTAIHAMSTHITDLKNTPESAQKTEVISKVFPKDHQSQTVPIVPAVQTTQFQS